MQRGLCAIRDFVLAKRRRQAEMVLDHEIVFDREIVFDHEIVFDREIDLLRRAIFRTAWRPSRSAADFHWNATILMRTFIELP